MKKKGFTLVELLAVIAILAILVIVAVPNVVSSLKKARKNTFMNEVQTVYSNAKTQWVTDQIENTTTSIYYSNDANLTVSGTEPIVTTISLDGSKTYYVNMNNDGEVTKLFVADKNYCYYYAAASSGTISSGQIKSDDLKTGTATITFDDDKVPSCTGNYVN